MAIRAVHACILSIASLLAPSPAAGLGPPPATSHAYRDGAFSGWAAPLPRPLRVVRSFQPPATTYGAGHRGVDLAAGGGSIVTTPASGRVVYAGALAGRGVVSIAIGDIRTTFEPVSPLVHVGEWVIRGAPIATVTYGHAGCPSGCLHWGVRTSSGYLDPMLTLGAHRVRLITPEAFGP